MVGPYGAWARRFLLKTWPSRRLTRGRRGPLVIIADRQTAGRGRAGRPWQAPDGNLNFSALVRPGAVTLQSCNWSLLAGIAVHDAVAAHIPDTAGLMLKWPNDLLLHGAKMAGVLIESALSQSGLVDWVVIGIGVNLAVAPSLPGRATSCLADAGVALAPHVLARTLAAELDHWLNEAPDSVRRAWLARAHQPGTKLRVHQGDQVIEGAFAGLADDGSLRLMRTGGVTLLVSGDVCLSDT